MFGYEVVELWKEFGFGIIELQKNLDVVPWFETCCVSFIFSCYFVLNSGQLWC